jgi:hypothetical protein
LRILGWIHDGPYAYGASRREMLVCFGFSRNAPARRKKNFARHTKVRTSAESNARRRKYGLKCLGTRR